MIHVAEMQGKILIFPNDWRDTTSQVHTAVKLMDNYTNNLVFHVLDASKAVSASSNIIGENSEEYKKKILRKYSDIKENYLLRKSQKQYVPIEIAEEKFIHYARRLCSSKEKKLEFRHIKILSLRI